MACETILRPRQSLSERKSEVQSLVKRIDTLILSRRAKVRVGPQGAVAFEGISEVERGGMTDACIYRRIMSSGSALARAEIARAEQIAGKQVDRRVIGQGVHSHDGGGSWDGGHK